MVSASTEGAGNPTADTLKKAGSIERGAAYPAVLTFQLQTIARSEARISKHEPVGMALRHRGRDIIIGGIQMKDPVNEAAHLHRRAGRHRPSFEFATLRLTQLLEYRAVG